MMRFAKYALQLFRYTSIVTLILALYVHVTSLFIGRDLIQQYIFTPRFDLFAGTLMTCSCLAGWLSWGQAFLDQAWKKILYAMILIYFTVEIPLHIQIAMTQRTDFIDALPAGFSSFMAPLVFCMLVFVWNLHFQASD